MKQQQNIDRKQAENDFRVNVNAADLEIELPRQKIHRPRATEMMTLIAAVKELTAMLQKS